jgi:hypothetical protein
MESHGTRTGGPRPASAGVYGGRQWVDAAFRLDVARARVLGAKCFGLALFNSDFLKIFELNWCKR